MTLLYIVINYFSLLLTFAPLGLVVAALLNTYLDGMVKKYED